MRFDTLYHDYVSISDSELRTKIIQPTDIYGRTQGRTGFYPVQSQPQKWKSFPTVYRVSHQGLYPRRDRAASRKVLYQLVTSHGKVHRLHSVWLLQELSGCQAIHLLEYKVR